MNCRILHAADIHLDSPLLNLSLGEGAPLERIRGASRLALTNLVDLAIDREVHLVVIAGDLYDGEWKDAHTGRFFVRQAARLRDAGIELLVIRGNHDSASQITSTLHMPSNPQGGGIFLRSDRAETRQYEFGDSHVAIHGRSYRKRHEDNSFVTSYPASIGGVFNLGLLHTSLTGSKNHDDYASCTEKQLDDFGYDYWALGHIHDRREIRTSGDSPPIVFSGNIQGRKIIEPGAKGCYLLEVSKSKLEKQTFIPLDVARFSNCKLEISSELKSTAHIAEQFHDSLIKELSEVGERLLLPRVTIEGHPEDLQPLRSRFRELEDHLRGVADDVGVGEQVWIEKVKLRSFKPEATDAQQDSDGIRPIADQQLEGIRQSLTLVTSGLANHIFRVRTDDGEDDSEPDLFSQSELADESRESLDEWMREQLEMLSSRVPAGCVDEAWPIQWEDAGNLANWLAEAESELMGRLMERQN